jgi:hypothetical protein
MQTLLRAAESKNTSTQDLAFREFRASPGKELGRATALSTWRRSGNFSASSRKAISEDVFGFTWSVALTQQAALRRRFRKLNFQSLELGELGGYSSCTKNNGPKFTIHID